LCLFANLAVSQPPSPSPTPPTKNNQSQTAGKDPIATNDKNNSNSVSAAIDKLTSEIASWKNKQTADNSDGNASSDGWLKWSTIISAVATLAIAGLGGLQWWAMHKQRAAMEEQANYMREGLAETRKWGFRRSRTLNSG
jgi:hypothetical protein